MKKLIIGGLVGGILLFLWQTLSWTVLDLHGKEYQQAPGQDTVLNSLNSQLTKLAILFPIQKKEPAQKKCKNEKTCRENHGQHYITKHMT